jgi:hypothetical protein
MMRRALLCAFAAFAVMLAPRPARAWDEIGHMAVARIAWESMTPEARAAAVAILRGAPPETGIAGLVSDPFWAGSDPDRELFTRTATWADIIRGREAAGHQLHQPSWHYVNFFWEQPAPGAPGRDLDRPHLGLAVDSLQSFLNELQSGVVSQERKAVVLAWVLHLTGDVHQPLHASARVSAASPDGDKGGNDFKLEGRHNLHSYWDSAITRADGVWLPGERTVGDFIGGIASGIMRRNPRARFAAALRDVRVEDWAHGSFVTARTRLYPASLHAGEEPPAAYDAMSKQVAESAVALAGYRLADALDRALGH